MKKKSNARPPARRTKTTKLFLPVQFTHDELHEIGLSLAAKHKEIGELTVKKKLEADRFKDLIDTATSEASRLATNRINGWENRYVDCEITYDFEKGTKQTVRLDLGEVVKEEPMEDSERQLAFDAIATVADVEEQPATH
jgi:hypothetical protein